MVQGVSGVRYGCLEWTRPWLALDVHEEVIGDFDFAQSALALQEDEGGIDLPVADRVGSTQTGAE